MISSAFISSSPLFASSTQRISQRYLFYSHSFAKGKVYKTNEDMFKRLVIRTEYTANALTRLQATTRLRSIVSLSKPKNHTNPNKVAEQRIHKLRSSPTDYKKGCRLKYFIGFVVLSSVFVVFFLRDLRVGIFQHTERKWSIAE